MARITKPPIPLKLYKHFAVATLSLTAMIAMFADNDQRKAMEEQSGIEDETTIGDLAREAQREAPRLVGADEIETQGSFGSEGGSFGAPMYNPGGTGGGVGGSAGYAPARAREEGRISVRGYDQAWIDGMSEEEYRAFREAIPPEMRERGDEAERARSFQRAAERRSGHRSANNDEPSA